MIRAAVPANTNGSAVRKSTTRTTTTPTAARYRFAPRRRVVDEHGGRQGGGERDGGLGEDRREQDGDQSQGLARNTDSVKSRLVEPPVQDEEPRLQRERHQRPAPVRSRKLRAERRRGCELGRHDGEHDDRKHHEKAPAPGGPAWW